MKQESLGKQQWIVKTFNRFGPVGRNMLRRKEWADSNCKACGQEETTEHLWRCPSRQTLLPKLLKDLRVDLKDLQTDRNLLHDIVAGIHYYLGGPYPDYRTDVGLKQHRIGWSLPFTGFWHRDWCTAQQAHCNRRESQRTGTLWLTRVIRRIWVIPWTLWLERNDQLHRHHKTNQHLEIQAEVRRIVQAKSTYPLSVQQLMTAPSHLLAKPPLQLKAWLSKFCTTLQRSKWHQQHRVREKFGRTIRRLTNA